MSVRAWDPRGNEIDQNSRLTRLAPRGLASGRSPLARDWRRRRGLVHGAGAAARVRHARPPWPSSAADLASSPDMRGRLIGGTTVATKPKVRGGIVGSGFAANLHYEGIRRVYGTDVDLVGIFSPTAANARRFAEPRGLKTFPSLNALLDEVEVAHVCASPA